MKKISIIGAFILLIPACVTINIYFPAAAAEEAADKIIDEVWQLKPGETKPDDAAPVKPVNSNPDMANPANAPAK
ncbi:MAG: hypothetical protein V4605_02845 [Pseudomonadota bacterium]